MPEPGERQQGQFPVQTFNPYIADVQIHALLDLGIAFLSASLFALQKSNFLNSFATVPFDETFYVSCEIKSKTESSLVVDVIAHNQQGKIYTRILGAKGTILPKQYN